jgi:glutaconyl-CoA/methylmalonyl-CoA decarboxylase subunit gamma
MEEIIINVKGKKYKVKIEETDGKVKVYFGNEVYQVDTKSDIEPLFADSIKEKEEVEESKGDIKAPLPGTVVAVNVKIGDKVKKGDSLVKLIAMKMENDITAQTDGVVKEIKIKKDDVVQKGDILMVIE